MDCGTDKSIDKCSWQEFLDRATYEANKSGILSGRKSELNFSRMCLEHESLRSQVVKWMGSCLQNSEQKSASESKNFRTRGNEEFKRRHDNKSLFLYSESIRLAPYDSEEFALGLANRSAVLFHLQMYKECANDAEYALNHGYPLSLSHKLLFRLTRCYLHLNLWDKCKTTLDSAGSHMSNLSFPTPQKEKEAKEELELLLTEYSSKKNDSQRSQTMPVKEERDIELPEFSAGSSSEYPSMSSSLELKYSTGNGRFVLTNQEIKQGEILFIEKPYALVVLPDQFRAHCHHCCRAMVAPYPCRNCVDVLFCSESCESKSNRSYHKWECGGEALMSAIGVAHLSLRIVLKTGLPLELQKKADAAKASCATFQHLGDHQIPYSEVYSLLPHIEDMELDDVFQYSLTATLLTLYLLHKTDYFETIPDLNENKSNSSVSNVCAIILRHIAQLVCNAHAITKVDTESESSRNDVVTESQQRIATAIYPSASMMNHSCDPNIVNSFHNEILIVKASRDIPKGGEVFNCYGPHFRRMSTAERQAALQAQYFFFCQCSACVATPGESFNLLQERLSALRCQTCSGPLLTNAPGREPAGSKTTEKETNYSHHMVCDACGVLQPISSLVHDAFSAHSLFKYSCEAMEAGHMQEALSSLKSCRDLQERALFCHNKDLSATYDMLAKCHAMLGHYEESKECLQKMMPAVEEQFGSNSVEVANELQKLSDVMLCNLRSMESVPTMEQVSSASDVVKRAEKILSLHYGEWNQAVQDLHGKSEELRVMVDMAGLQSEFHSRIKI